MACSEDGYNPTSSWPFRLAYLADSEVNWCPALGTVLANDEVKGRVERTWRASRRQRKRMRQWIMRISALLLSDACDQTWMSWIWTDSIKDAQRNWIGRSEGAERPIRQVARSQPDRNHGGLHDPARHLVWRELHGLGAGTPLGARNHCSAAAEFRAGRSGIIQQPLLR